MLLLPLRMMCSDVEIPCSMLGGSIFCLPVPPKWTEESSCQRESHSTEPTHAGTTNMLSPLSPLYICCSTTLPHSHWTNPHRTSLSNCNPSLFRNHYINKKNSAKLSQITSNYKHLQTYYFFSTNVPLLSKPTLNI